VPRDVKFNEQTDGLLGLLSYVVGVLLYLSL